jgi:hypothetical protein
LHFALRKEENFCKQEKDGNMLILVLLGISISCYVSSPLVRKHLPLLLWKKGRDFDRVGNGIRILASNLHPEVPGDPRRGQLCL